MGALSIHAEVLTGLTSCLPCAGNYSCCNLTHATAMSCPETSISQFFSRCVSSYILTAPSFESPDSCMVGGSDRWPVHSWELGVIYTQPFDQLWVCIDHQTLKREVCLTEIESSIVYESKLKPSECSLTAWPCSKTTVGSPLAPMIIQSWAFNWVYIIRLDGRLYY